MHHLAVPKYLEHILKKLRKEAELKEAKVENVEEKAPLDADAEDNEFENEKDEPKEEKVEKPVKTTGIPANKLEELAKELGSNWKQLAEELRTGFLLYLNKNNFWKTFFLFDAIFWPFDIKILPFIRHITSKDIKNTEEDAEDDFLRAKIALVLWQDKNGAEATQVIF